MADCLFCGILKGEVPGRIVYEDDYACVFMDIAGDVDGHMVAVPKKHCKSLLDCDAETLHHLMDVVKLVSKHCIRRCGYEGINLLNASEECAGQSVPHFHMHIIPRKNGDGVDAWPKLPGSRTDLNTMYELLQIE